MASMTEMMSDVDDTNKADPSTVGVDQRLVDQLVERARAGGVALTGEGGLLAQLTKRVLESALDGEITDHLGYDKHDPAGHNSGNSPTAPGRRRCSPTSARSRWRCPVTARAVSSRGSWPNGSGGWPGWMRW